MNLGAMVMFYLEHNTWVPNQSYRQINFEILPAKLLKQNSGNNIVKGSYIVEFTSAAFDITAN